MRALVLLLVTAACSKSSDSGGDGLDTGDLITESHVDSTASGSFASGETFLRIDVQTATEGADPRLERVDIDAIDMASYNDMTLEDVEVYVGDEKADVPVPVVGWSYEPVGGVPVPDRLHGYAEIWDGSRVDFDYDMSMLSLHAIDSPQDGVTLHFGEDVPVTWSPSGGNVGWAIGLWGQQAQTEWKNDDVGSGVFPGSDLTVEGEDTLWVARYTQTPLDGPKTQLGHLHEARVSGVVEP